MILYFKGVWKILNLQNDLLIRDVNSEVYFECLTYLERVLKR